MGIFKLLSEKNADPFGKRPVTLAFLGDSVTQGCFETYKSGDSGVKIVYDYDAVYHTQLKRMFSAFYPAATVNVINAGVSGDTAPGGLKRLERDVLGYAPDFVTVCFGLNDVNLGAGADHFGDALDGIFKKLAKEGISALYMTPNMMNTEISPMIYDDGIKRLAAKNRKLQLGGAMDGYMDAAREVCRQNGVPVCDVYAKWKTLYESGADITNLLANHLNHPTREMHGLFAHLLLESFRTV